MRNMPRQRPPSLQRETTRHGTPVWYVRKERHGPRIRLRAEYGTPEFWQEYQDALSGLSRRHDKATAASLAWLVERHRETSAWTDLSLAIGGSARTSCVTFSSLPATSRRMTLSARTLLTVVIGARQPRCRPGISSTPCVAYSSGQLKRSTSRQIRH
jgi:hypothetical protein